MPNLIVSTLGTSLLLNLASEEKLKTMLRQTANYKDHEFNREQQKKIEDLKKLITYELNKANVNQIRRLSAELNGIYGYYGSNIQKDQINRDVHWFLSSDTFQGNITAGLIEGHLRQQGFREVYCLTPRNFDTKNTDNFSGGIKEIAKWCEDNIQTYRDNNYHVVFNLVGGFKSVQGYLNTLGMFYADEIIYIFESAAELIRIPRLPVTLNEIPVMREKTALFALMANSYLAVKEEAAGITELLLDCDDEVYTLSLWGLLLWNKHKQNILGDSELLSYPGLIPEKGFVKEFNGIKDKIKKAHVLEKLAKASVIYSDRGLEGLRADGGLLYENYKGEDNIGHFRLDQDWRVSCRWRGSNLILRHLGPHDYVNNLETRS